MPERRALGIPPRSGSDRRAASKTKYSLPSAFSVSSVVSFLMSKFRQAPTVTAADLGVEPDLRGYVVFTQLKKDGPFIYAGWLDAADDEMALTFACEHYGQDQKCVHIWTAPREFVGGLRENADAAQEPVAAPREYQLFRQDEAGDAPVSAYTVTATSAAEAIAAGRRELDGGADIHTVWAIPTEHIAATDDDDLIWRYTDQTYRLARGYSKGVREKWEKLRADRDLTEYEKDDLKETF